MISEEVLTDVQIAMYERIVSDTFLPMAKFRQDKGVVANDIAISLSVLTKAGDKIGSAIIVQSPLASIELNNVPGSPLKPRLSFRVLEDPLFNMHPDKGTLFPALKTARRLASLFHLFGYGGLINPLVGEEPTIVPVQDEIAPIAYEVRFWTTETNSAVRPKVSLQKINTPGGTVAPATATFTVDPSDAQVIYTTDGSYPRDHSADLPAYTGNAAVWDGQPIAIAEAKTLLACAYKADYIPGDVFRKDFTA